MDDVLNRLFLDARTHNAFHREPIARETLVRLYEAVRMGPTSANSQPARFVFVQGREAKERLQPCLSPGNVDKTMAAPVTVIVATDLEFRSKMAKIFPPAPAIFDGMGPEAVANHLRLNGALQAAYLIIAARAMGLDCGPMGGFDNAKVDAAFFAGTGWRSLLLVNLGHGDASKLFPRSPRLSFEEACRIV